MKILCASSNKHKICELKAMLAGFEVFAFDELLKPFEIAETGQSFKENALIKSRAVFKALSKKEQAEFIVLSDDSGICVEALGGRPGIYSARFSKEGSDKANRAKLMSELEALNLEQSKAHYTACIALSSSFGDFSTHGFMHGRIINKERGNNGFGYDSLFVPQGFDKTLGELDESIKAKISHRFKAVSLAQVLLRNLI